MSSFRLGAAVLAKAVVGNTVFARHLRFYHATSGEAKLRTFVSIMYKAGSW
jgi:hypothetical protein